MLPDNIKKKPKKKKHFFSFSLVRSQLEWLISAFEFVRHRHRISITPDRALRRYTIQNQNVTERLENSETACWLITLMLNIRNYVMILRGIKQTEVDCCQIYEGRNRLIDTFRSDVLVG